MRENRFFVRSTDLRGHLAARIGETPAILSYGSAIERVAALAGPDAASLFAEPVLPRGISDAGTAISWYSTHEGVVVELDTIDEVARRPIAERLTQRLAALGPALSDQEVGPTLSTWLNITSPSDVLAVGGEPVLVNWGFLPTDHIPPLDHRRQEFAQGLGRYAPHLLLPPAQIPATQAAAAVDAPAEATAGATDSVGGAPPPPGPPPVRGQAHMARSGGPPPPPGDGGNSGSLAPGNDGNRKPWLAPLVATAVAALALLLLLMPGVLVYPSSGTSTTSRDFEADRLRESTESMEQQLKALQDAARNRVCRSADLRISVPQPGNGNQTPSPQMEVLPQTPERLPVPPNARTGGDDAAVANVADLMEKATVLVIGLKLPSGLGEGSGFFISDRHIVTNHHVIAQVDPDLIFVASQSLGGARHAKLIAKTMPPPSDTDLRPDFAVLEIEPANRPVLKLGPTPAKLSTAYVAGYPFFLVSRDVQFAEFLKKLIQHHSDAELAQERIRVPGADLRLGRVNNIMYSGGNAVSVVVHDMQLAQGNSGGPLVDGCGRLGGVNTLLFPSDQGSQQGNVAEDVSVLNKFLTEQHIAFQTDETPCQAPVAASAPNPPQGPEANK
jgi:S1-C subfamily serine protease